MPARRQNPPSREDSAPSASTLHHPTDLSQPHDDTLEVIDTHPAPHPDAQPFLAPGNPPRGDELYEIELEKARIDLEHRRKTIRFRRGACWARKATAGPLQQQMMKVRSPPKQERLPFCFPLSRKSKSPQSSKVPSTRNIFINSIWPMRMKMRLPSSKKRTGTVKDYPYPDTWSSAFLQYIAILSEFDKYHRLTRSLIFFHARIMELSRTHTWESVALTFHRERVINDKKSWQLPPALIDKHLRTSLKPAKPSASIKPSTASTYRSSSFKTSDPSTEYCFRWNAGGLSASENMPAFDVVKTTSQEATRRPREGL
ncbi:hypothetical protein V8E54_009525 [Elaphomyces granulatus]